MTTLKIKLGFVLIPAVEYPLLTLWNLTRIFTQLELELELELLNEKLRHSLSR